MRVFTHKAKSLVLLLNQVKTGFGNLFTWSLDADTYYICKSLEGVAATARPRADHRSSFLVL
jgi:hypothetical protein